jgi:hypothetical protein
MAEQSLEVTNFAGGMTDNFIGGALNKFQSAVNFTIRPDGKLESRFGSDVIDNTNYLVPFISTQKRVDSICEFEDIKIYQSMNKVHFATTGWNEITGPTGNSAFSSAVTQFNQNSWDTWNRHLMVTNDYRERPVFIYKDGSNMRLRTLGLPKVTNAQVTAITTTVGVGNSRNYRFVRVHTYTINGVEFEARSAVSADKPYSGPIPNTLGALPVLTNGASDNYDTTTIKLEIYRTANAGVDYFKVGEVTNGTTTFVDSVVDGSLSLGLVLYTDTDELDYDQPPKCKQLFQVNGIFYYLNVESSEGVIPQRVIQANPDQPYAANEGNYIDLDEDITAGGAAGVYPVVFTKNRTYRLEGFFGSDGSGGITRVEISRTVGCVSHKSVVQTLEGLFFAGTDGFYFTDGYRLQKISEDIPATYSRLVETEAQAKRIYGTYDPNYKRIYWACSKDSDFTENNIIFIAHLQFGISPNTPFTTWDGGYWQDNFAPTALLFDGQVLVSGDKRGYVLKFTEGLYDDKKINTATVPSTWLRLPIIYDYRSVALDFGNVTLRKWVPKIVVYADSISRVAFTIFSNNDNTGVFSELAEVRSNSPVNWRDFGILWDDPSIRWNYLPIVSGIRRFPARSIRCSYKQVKFTNAYTMTDSTASSGTVTVDGVANTVTLENTTATWDDNAVDYYISFSDDNHVKQYKILNRTALVLTVEDTDNTLPSGAAKAFKIFGYRKSEALRLLSYSLIYSLTTPTQTPFKAEAG